MEKNTQTKFKIGDLLVYRKSGVCRVNDIRSEKLTGSEKRDYYVMSSVYESNTKIFIPLDSELERGLSPVPTVEQIEGFIKESKNFECEWNENGKERAKFFDNIIRKGTRNELLWMIRRINDHRKELEEQNKKIKSNDIKYLVMAENIIAGEFAYVLGLNKKEVSEYLEEKLRQC